MMRDLLPPNVALAEARGGGPWHPLFAEEESVLRRAGPRRRREFTSGRACARTALRDLGLRPRAVPTGTHGAPLWPDGVVGSITHSETYVACAVAHRHEVRSLGIDAEPNVPLPPEVLGVIAGASEIAMVGALPADVEVCWDRLLFSAKEAAFKAWHPASGRLVEPQAICIEIDATAERFAVRLPEGPLDEETTGRWCVSRNYVLTAIAVPNRRSDPADGLVRHRA